MEMTAYEPGTPSWVDAGVPDTDAAAAFYGGLFGWEVEASHPDAGGYRIATLKGKPVAGLGPQMAPGLPVWTTYFSTVDVDETATKVTSAGGQILMPPMTVMDQGRMAVFLDDTGSAFAAWQPIAHPGAALVNEPGTLSWNELNTRNPAEAKAFYESVLGVKARDQDMGEYTYTEWLVADRSVGGMRPMVGDEWPAEVPNHWMVYFAVDDTDAAAAKVAELGGTVQVEPFDIPQVGRMAVLSDPAGTHFSIIAMAAQEG